MRVAREKSRPVSCEFKYKPLAGKQDLQGKCGSAVFVSQVVKCFLCLWHLSGHVGFEFAAQLFL